MFALVLGKKNKTKKNNAGLQRPRRERVTEDEEAERGDGTQSVSTHLGAGQPKGFALLAGRPGAVPPAGLAAALALKIGSPGAAVLLQASRGEGKGGKLQGFLKIAASRAWQGG